MLTKEMIEEVKNLGFNMAQELDDCVFDEDYTPNKHDVDEMLKIIKKAFCEQWSYRWESKEVK